MSSHDKRGNARALDDDEIRKIMRNGTILAVSAILFMGVMTLLVHTEAIRLYPSNMSVEMVKGYAGRVEFTLRYQTLLVFWLSYMILHTIHGRMTKKALNPLIEATEQHVQMRKNILTNSLESIVISVFSQLIFVSFATPESILKVIPLINIIQFVGRIGFLLGYPLLRSFGFTCTLIPNLYLTVHNLFHFGSFVGLYWTW